MKAEHDLVYTENLKTPGQIDCTEVITDVIMNRTGRFIFGAPVIAGTWAMVVAGTAIRFEQWELVGQTYQWVDKGGVQA
jgi:hypothetical protein